jgi:hypothetical protein
MGFSEKEREKSVKTREDKQKKKKAEFLQVYSQKANNVHLTCKAVGISRATFYAWIRDDDDFRETIWHVEEGDIDAAETALKRQVLDGNITAIIFYLKTKGKNRGYVERQELTGMDGQKLFEVSIVDDNG